MQQHVSRWAAWLAPLLVLARTASADPAPATAPIEPDPPARPPAIVVPRANLQPSWDLDGTYLWLGPIGAASYVDAGWDSTVGGEAALVVVRERAALGVIGGSVGATRWTQRGGGRVWLDSVIGTRLAGRMMGASIGAIAELSEISRAKLGGSIGVWVFAGVTPFVRVGMVSELGMFADLGIHIALPVLRR